jgi:thiamine-phosphate pyrophosphorylase
MKLDPRVYVITTMLPRLGREHVAIAEAAVRGGATVVQFRDKTMSDAEFAATAGRIARITRGAGIPLIINDRVEIAIAMGAQGVHVGQHDAPARDLRDSLPAGMILGVSASNYGEALEAAEAGADYLGVGPVFPTGSKDDATPPIGLRQLARICREVRRPVVAIGGITQENLRTVIETGVAGAAVIAAIAEAGDMAAAVAALRREWDIGSGNHAAGSNALGSSQH